jgi:hypothetical protein
MWDHGIRVLDQFTETRQVQWLVVRASECIDHRAEERLARRHFPVPHAIWTWPPAFVEPVVIRRTRRRVLLCQRSGVGL